MADVAKICATMYEHLLRTQAERDAAIEQRNRLMWLYEMGQVRHDCKPDPDADSWYAALFGDYHVEICPETGTPYNVTVRHLEYERERGRPPVGYGRLVELDVEIGEEEVDDEGNDQ